MRTIVAGRQAITKLEFSELALGFSALFEGVDGESAMERATRLDVARDVLTELWREDRELAEHAARLLDDPPTDVVELPVRMVPGRWAA